MPLVLYFLSAECNPRGVDSPTVVAAQVANELLNIDHTKASFVFTEYQDKIYISARSIDEVNVQVVMEKIGGGGHMSVAGAQLKGSTIQEAMERIKEVLRKMTDALSFVDTEPNVLPPSPDLIVKVIIPS